MHIAFLTGFTPVYKFNTFYGQRNWGRGHKAQRASQVEHWPHHEQRQCFWILSSLGPCNLLTQGCSDNQSWSQDSGAPRFCTQTVSHDLLHGPGGQLSRFGATPPSSPPLALIVPAGPWLVEKSQPDPSPTDPQYSSSCESSPSTATELQGTCRSKTASGETGIFKHKSGLNHPKTHHKLNCHTGLNHPSVNRLFSLMKNSESISFSFYNHFTGFQ